MSAKAPAAKPLKWMGDSRKRIQRFPEPVKDEMGQALWIAQQGGKHRTAKPLKGFKGAGVLEVVEDFAGDTYRAVTRCGSNPRSMCCIASRKKANAVRKRRRLTWI
jgi:phage-related protein